MITSFGIVPEQSAVQPVIAITQDCLRDSVEDITYHISELKNTKLNIQIN